jgi:hypothetical protein
MAMHLQIEHGLQGEIQPIYNSILDMRHFGKHHPYMRQVNILTTTPDFTEYEIHEMVWIFGIIPQWPRYTARVYEKEKLRHIQYTSAVKGGLDLKIDFHFTNNENSIFVAEKIAITGNALLGNILMSTMRKAHLELFHSIQKSLNA